MRECDSYTQLKAIEKKMMILEKDKKNTQKLPTDLLQYISTIQKINNNKYLCLYNRFFWALNVFISYIKIFTFRALFFMSIYVVFCIRDRQYGKLKQKFMLTISVKENSKIL